MHSERDEPASVGMPRAEQERQSARAAWMQTLALARTEELLNAIASLGALPARHWIRAPETGMTMVQGRSGGTGARFNLGEMTITRCAVVLRDATRTVGDVGIAYVQGRSARHAECAAIADALLQSPDWRHRVETQVLTPLRSAYAARAEARAADVAKTRVNFSTMARENPNA